MHGGSPVGLFSNKRLSSRPPRGIRDLRVLVHSERYGFHVHERGGKARQGSNYHGAGIA